MKAKLKIDNKSYLYQKILNKLVSKFYESDKQLWIFLIVKFHSHNLGFFFLEITPIFRADLQGVLIGSGFFGQ